MNSLTLSHINLFLTFKYDLNWCKVLFNANVVVLGHDYFIALALGPDSEIRVMLRRAVSWPFQNGKILSKSIFEINPYILWFYSFSHFWVFVAYEKFIFTIEWPNLMAKTKKIWNGLVLSLNECMLSKHELYRLVLEFWSCFTV